MVEAPRYVGMRGTRRFSRVGMASVLLAVSTASCSDDAGRKPATLPPVTPSSISPTPATTEGLSDKEQVRAVYVAYVAGYPKGERMSPRERREYLAQWLIEPVLTRYVDGMERQAKEGQVSEGKRVVRIFSIKVAGKTAHVDDCADESGVSLKDAKTGDIVKKGKPNVWAVATLKKTSAGWRISNTDANEESCAKR